MTKRLFMVALGAALMAGVITSCQSHYTKTFRLSTEDPDQVSDFKRLIDGPLGEFHHSQLFLRVVALYDSNNKRKMRRDLFNVVLEQRLTEGTIDTIGVDSLVCTLRPSGERLVLQRQKLILYQGEYSPEPRIRSTFGSLAIPPGIDTVLVDFVARGSLSAGESMETKSYALTLIRFEGSKQKFGIFPKDEL